MEILHLYDPKDKYHMQAPESIPVFQLFRAYMLAFACPLAP